MPYNRIILPLLMLFSFSAFSAVSSKVNLVGTIVSFNEKKVGVQSGQRIFSLSKSQLKFSSYKVGQKIKIAMNWDEFQKLKSKSVKRRSKRR